MAALRAAVESAAYLWALSLFIHALFNQLMCTFFLFTVNVNSVFPVVSEKVVADIASGKRAPLLNPPVHLGPHSLTAAIHSPQYFPWLCWRVCVFVCVCVCVCVCLCGSVGDC